jgi:hypothetical protein
MQNFFQKECEESHEFRSTFNPYKHSVNIKEENLAPKLYWPFQIQTSIAQVTYTPELQNKR